MERTGPLVLLAGAGGGLALVTVRWPQLALRSDRLWVFAAVTGALVGFLVWEALRALWRRGPSSRRAQCEAPRSPAARRGQ